jgi:hypothetical protein
MRSQRPHKDDESEKWPYPIWHLAALRTARENGIVTIGFTGTKGKHSVNFANGVAARMSKRNESGWAARRSH